VTLLYFAPVPWDSYLQRPHYFARHFLQHAGQSVVWIDPYPARMPALADLGGVWRRRLRTPRPPGLTVVRPGAIPIEPLATGRWLNRTLLWHRLHRRLPPFSGGKQLIVGIGRPHSLALAALERLDPARSFYDAMDDFPEFYRGRAQRAAAASEQAIVSSVNAILVASAGLWSKFAAHGDKRIMIRNGFDMASLPPVAPRPSGPPVLGYVGSVASWFDWPLVIRLARAVPNALVHVVGPRYAAPPRPLPPNLKLFPACAHEAAVEHIRRFSVGLIPFKRNRLTAGVDPIKYYGYRAMGLSVLTTAFGDMAGRGPADGVFILDDDAGLEAGTYAALGAQVDDATIARFREEHSWERRFDGVWGSHLAFEHRGSSG
jgi:hypothetical protein